MKKIIPIVKNKFINSPMILSKVFSPYLGYQQIQSKHHTSIDNSVIIIRNAGSLNARIEALAILALSDSALEKSEEEVAGLYCRICVAVLLYAMLLYPEQSRRVSSPECLAKCVQDAEALLLYLQPASQVLLLHLSLDRQLQIYKHIQIAAGEQGGVASPSLPTCE